MTSAAEHCSLLVLAAKLAGDGNLRVAKYCAPSALERASCVKLLAQAAMSTNDQESHCKPHARAPAQR